MRAMRISYILITLLLNVSIGFADSSTGYVTQTVYGFLDFTTTIGDTVMVFSPQSAPPLDLGKIEIPAAPVKVIETKPIQTSPSPSAPPTSSTTSSSSSTSSTTFTPGNDIRPTKLESSSKVADANPQKPVNLKDHGKGSNSPSSAITSSSLSSIVSVSTSNRDDERKVTEAAAGNNDDDDDAALQIENNLYQPEYDLLSRQPTEYAEESYRVVNLKSNGRKRQQQQQQQQQQQPEVTPSSTGHPVGLVTKLAGSEVKDGVTTVYETSVIGTYISGKYAQVLQRSSQVYNKNNKKAKIRPTSSLRILKTASPQPSVVNAASPSSVISVAAKSPSSGSKRLAGSSSGGGGGGRFRGKNSQAAASSSPASGHGAVVLAESSVDQTTESRSGTSKKSSSRSKAKRRNKSRPSSSSSSPSSSSSGGHRAAAPAPQPQSEANNRRSFRPKVVHPSPVADADSSSSVYMFKLNRAPGRWQYKSSPKPRVNIRKQASDSSPANGLANVTTPAGVSGAGYIGSISDQINGENLAQNSILDQGDLESSGSQSGSVLNNVDSENKQRLFVETLNVEISTPANFKDTYYEIATIKTPFTFQVGVLKKTRFITVTSTIEKTFAPEPSATATLNEPLTENILEPRPSRRDHLVLDGSITTLPPLHLTDTGETPSLETVTESFTFTQTKLRTQVLPVIYENGNGSDGDGDGNSSSTSYITMVQTYDITSLITATKTLSPLDALDGTRNFKDFGGNLDEAGSELNLELEFGDEDNGEPESASYGRPGDSSSSTASKSSALPASQALTPEQIQQLALINLYNPVSRPIVRQETVWESQVIPIVSAGSTMYRTLSKSVGVIDKTEYQVEPTQLPSLVPPPLASPPPPPQVSPINPFLLPVPQHPFQTITSSYVHQTIVTQTNSKVLKLTFGARTAYTTIFSTNVVPTAVTMVLTTSLPVQPTAAFPGYYPPPYPPFAYVG